MSLKSQVDEVTNYVVKAKVELDSPEAIGLYRDHIFMQLLELSTAARAADDDIRGLTASLREKRIESNNHRAHRNAAITMVVIGLLVILFRQSEVAGEESGRFVLVFVVVFWYAVIYFFSVRGDKEPS